MERAEWIAAKRCMAEERYDTLFAATFDQEWGHINASHRAQAWLMVDVRSSERG